MACRLLCRLTMARTRHGWRRFPRADGAPVAPALVATLASLPLALGSSALRADIAASRWLAAYPPDALHHVALLLDGTARAGLALLVIAALAVDGRRWLDATAGFAAVACGAFLGELLKTACERLRPSALPGATTGNSFPSGHVMNTTLVAVVAWQLAAALPTGWRRTARAAAVLAVGAQAAARVLHGSHWPSDVGPSILLGVSWMLVAARLRWRHRWHFPLAAVSAAAYAFFLFVPSARVHLVSAIDRPRATLAVWDPNGAFVPTGGAPARAPTATSWSETLRSPAGAPDALELVIAARCHDEAERCRRVRVSVNGSHATDVGLHCGWHWYSVGRPAVGLRRGANEVVLHVPRGCPRSAFAVRSLALVGRQPRVPAMASADAVAPHA